MPFNYARNSSAKYGGAGAWAKKKKTTHKHTHSLHIFKRSNLIVLFSLRSSMAAMLLMAGNYVCDGWIECTEMREKCDQLVTLFPNGNDRKSVRTVVIGHGRGGGRQMWRLAVQPVLCMRLLEHPRQSRARSATRTHSEYCKQMAGQMGPEKMHAHCECTRMLVLPVRERRARAPAASIQIHLLAEFFNYYHDLPTDCNAIRVNYAIETVDLSVNDFAVHGQNAPSAECGKTQKITACGVRANTLTAIG